MDLLPQFHLIQALREYFFKEGFLDVLTPPVVSNPGMEIHIHPFQVLKAKSRETTSSYLQTSPEFHMKELLSEGLEKIFTISYCFRDEPCSTIHRSQFLMLEWYRANESYQKIMEDCEQLFTYCYKYLEQKDVPIDNQFREGFELERMTIQELFKMYLDIDILEYLHIDSIRELISKKFKEIPLPNEKEKLNWDDYFFLIFLNKIEPELQNHPFLLLYEYPYHLSALSTLKESDQRVCERFEIYVKGIEIANCFNELRDFDQQKERFSYQNEMKKKLYQYSLPEPKVLYNALRKGMPKSSGIALGVERMLYALVDKKKIKRYFWQKTKS